MKSTNIEQFPEHIFFSLKNLKELRISSNRINKIPNEICELNNLELLELDNNEVSHLPEDFGLLKNLKIINLKRNNLKNLPDSFESLENLEIIDLRNNELQQLPESLFTLPNLKELYIDFFLKKGLPTEIQDSKKFEIKTTLLANYVPTSIRDYIGGKKMTPKEFQNLFKVIKF